MFAPVLLHAHSIPASTAADLRAGDIVFIQVGGPLFSRIAATSKGWVSHVGVVVGKEQGSWMVAEAAVPRCRKTPLRSFLRRSVKGRFAIKRLRGEWTPAEVAALQAAVDRRMRMRYDFGFNLDASTSSFCSKFVYQVVLESTGQKLGDIETFQDLLAQNPKSPLWFWKAWFFGRIPWRRRTVTPESQFDSPLLATIRQSA